MTTSFPVPGEDPLVAALRRENERLRDRNLRLLRELEAAQRAQEDLVLALRMTAPLRRLQELARHRRQERRRRQSAAKAAGTPLRLVPGPPAELPGHDVRPRHSVFTQAQVDRHPLLARTRRWLEGEPISAPDLLPVRSGCSGRVLVVAHVFYPEIWPELVDRILRIPAPVDLIVTVVEGRCEALVDLMVAQFPGITVVTVPNRGRDMWSLVHVAELGLLGDYDAVLKLHTKRSVHRLDGDAWRARMLDALCPSPEGIGLTLELLRRDESVGMVAPAGALLGREFWGGNTPLIEALAARTGIEVDPEHTWFPGGSMFWSRPGPLNALRDAGLVVEDFEHEAVALDATTAHALERFLGAVVRDCGQQVVASDEVPGRLAACRSRGAQRPGPATPDALVARASSA